MLHMKAVDDAGHDRNVPYRCAYLAAADAMLRQLLARLWHHQQQSGERYVLCVTGDHSTPVLFGDHSNEPVPFAAAHLADVVAALGGDAAVRATRLGAIRTPEFNPPPSGEGDDAGSGAAAAAEQAQPEAPPPPPRAAVAGDGVCAFDEVSVAAGGLGRFCGASVMPLLKAFADTAAETQTAG
jgi:2,3-bisphosphoglycerate-independent phosphoglycerate mutase